MRTFKKLSKVFQKQVAGLQKDIERGEARSERYNGKIDKLKEEIRYIESKRVLNDLDVLAAKDMQRKIASI